VALEIALILAIGYTPWGHLVFATMPIPGQVWLFMLPFAAGLFILEELRKWLARRLRGAGSTPKGANPAQ
jgi:hypothetical protein